MNGTVAGVKLGISIKSIVSELLEVPARMQLDQDNHATIESIAHEVTAWRTRRDASRAAWIWAPLRARI